MTARMPVRAFIGLVALVLTLLCPQAPAYAQSIEQMAGQMIIVGFKGDSVEDASVAAVREQIAAGGLGGVMYLKTNVASLKAVREMNAAFRAASPDLLPFIAIDQEGGWVERLTKDVSFKEVPTAAEVARTMSAAEAQKLYGEMARALAQLGFTVNFGPVADVDVNPDNPIIAKYGRAYSGDVAKVVAFDEAFRAAHEAAGMLTSLKHYPGHGSSSVDSHEGFVDISKSWKELVELMPFNAQFALGYNEFVMVGHLYHERFAGEGDRLPASLSRGWVTEMLRGKNGFEGVVITDDLEMGAIRKLFTLEETVRLAVMAGVDVLLFSNTADYSPELATRVRKIIVAQAQADPAFAERVRESYDRIRKLKLRLELIQRVSCNCPSIAGCAPQHIGPSASCEAE